jgi:hypothetical protein
MRGYLSPMVRAVGPFFLALPLLPLANLPIQTIDRDAYAFWLVELAEELKDQALIDEAYEVAHSSIMSAQDPNLRRADIARLTCLEMVRHNYPAVRQLLSYNSDDAAARSNNPPAKPGALRM